VVGAHTSIPMITIIRRSTITMVHVVQRQRSIHQPATTTALAAFYWAAAVTWAASSSSSSSFVVFGFNGGCGSPASFQRPSARANIISKIHRCGGTSATISTTVEQTTASTLPAASGMAAQSKVDALRGRMKELGLDVYLIPTDDPHLSGTYGSRRSSCFALSNTNKRF
jgi:hypothetical protein